MSDAECGEDERPLEDIVVKAIEVLWNPFDDIIPRCLLYISSCEPCWLLLMMPIFLQERESFCISVRSQRAAFSCPEKEEKREEGP